MASTPTPDSYSASAASSTWADFLQAIRDHVASISSNWDLKGADTDGSGGDGITITPSAPGERFDLNLRYDSSSGQPFIAVDPNGSITDPNDPTGSGSADVSTEKNPVGPSGPSFSTDLLIAEWQDAFAVIFKDSGGSYTPCFWLGGRLVEPAFANDPDRGLTGLAVCGATMSYEGASHSFTEHNNSATNELQTPDGWMAYGKSATTNGTPRAWNNSDTPFPIEVALSSNQTSGLTLIGLHRYVYKYHTPSGAAGLTVLSSGGGDGFLHLSKDGGDYMWLIGWDPAVSELRGMEATD